MRRITARAPFGRSFIKFLWVAVLVIGLLPVVLAVADFPQVGPAQAQTTTATCPPQGTSQGQLFYGTYSSSRLAVNDTSNPCKSATGTVNYVEKPETDGDVDLYVTLQSGYQDLACPPGASYGSSSCNANLSNLHWWGHGGDVIVELMPRDGKSSSSPNNPHLPEPIAGDTITIYGVWVRDTNHGYNEIHPTLSISINGGTTYTSGPQYAGSPQTSGASTAYTSCRDENNKPCIGYYNPNPTQTYLYLSASPTSVDYNGTTALSGYLYTYPPVVIVPDKTVEVWRSEAGSSTWTKEGTTTYDASSGQYKATTSPLTRNTTFQLRFAGDPWYKGATSSNAAVQAKAYLSTPTITPSSPTRNTDFTVSGYLKPLYTSGSTRVYFYYYWPGYGWYYPNTYVDAPNSQYDANTTKYSANYKLPYSGQWLALASHSDSDHAASSSYTVFNVN